MLRISAFIGLVSIALFLWCQNDSRIRERVFGASIGSLIINMFAAGLIKADLWSIPVLGIQVAAVAFTGAEIARERHDSGGPER